MNSHIGVLNSTDFDYTLEMYDDSFLHPVEFVVCCLPLKAKENEFSKVGEVDNERI